MKCLECKKEVKQTTGKREKLFCNSTCRSNYWQKAKRARDKPQPIKMKDLNKPTNEVKNITKHPPKTNYSIGKPFMSEAIRKKLGLK